MKYHLVISGTIGSWWNGCSADYVRYVLNKNSGKEVHVGFCSLGGFVKMAWRLTRLSVTTATYTLTPSA